MLDITFLNKSKPLNISVAGTEFMDYQNGDLFRDLVKFFDAKLSNTGGNWILEEPRKSAEKLEQIFMDHTGILLKLQTESVANAAVDAGWFNPGNVLNIKDIEKFYSVADSNIGNAFKRLKVDVLRGWVDTSTGKVGGDYSKIPFRLYMNKYIDQFISQKFIERYKVTMSEALAGILIHECGHVFSGFLHVHRNIVDPIIATTAVKLITDNKAYGKERVNIIRDAFKVLEIPAQVKDGDVESMTGDQLMVYFNKEINTRDVRRTLSLGTQDRSSEIYADLYSVRMGCGKSLVAALASLPDPTRLLDIITVLMCSSLIISILVCAPVLALMSGLYAGMLTLISLSVRLVPSNVYDSPYRRIKTILRDYVIRINDLSDMDNRNKVKLLADAKEIEKMVEDAKPFFEGTAVQRIVGFIISGNDFRAQEFENYTDDLIGHTLSLYKEAF